ncbi:MAG: hypothetical protein KJP07_05950 [Desulfatitalea sp.]|nr:hypothetical protein [Desulfatitalea sp.]
MDTITVCNISALGARMACKKHGISMVSVNMSPMMFMSRYDFPRFTTKPYPRWGPNVMFHYATKIIHRSFDRRLCPGENAFRQTLGLPPRRDILSWMVSPDRLIGLFPFWFGHPQPDWPVHTELVGFPLFDEGVFAGQTLPGDVADFFEQGPPPILFAPGTPNNNCAGFFAKAVDAVQQLDARAILLTLFRDQIPAELPPHYASFRLCTVQQNVQSNRAAGPSWRHRYRGPGASGRATPINRSR